jgi:hypothetical protein
MQLSWNDKFGAFEAYIGVDRLHKPESLESDGKLALIDDEFLGGGIVPD